MSNQIIPAQLQEIDTSIKNLSSTLMFTKNVDTHSKKSILGTEIDVKNLWISNETIIHKLTKTFLNSFGETFSISNKSAKLTKFDYGFFQYDDLTSKTTLHFKKGSFDKVTLEDNGNGIHLDKEQTEKFLTALNVSDNLKDMIKIVKNASKKLIDLECDNLQKNMLLTKEPTESELTIAAALDRINKINSNNTNTITESNKPKA